MRLKDIMRLMVYFILSTLVSCSSGSQKARTTADTSKSVATTDTSLQEEFNNDEDFRQEFISLYQKPILIDTSFLEDGKNYEVIFHHFSTMDSGLVVPAMYNLDTNKDFVTHNFASDLIVLSDKNIVFKKHITKSTFGNLLDTLETPLKQYATLLYPDLYFKNDSIEIRYSISIPVTDIGMPASIKFDKKGNYIITL
jgi:hypothetical protein